VVLGTVSARTKRGKLLALYAAPEFRRFGVGSRLLSQLEVETFVKIFLASRECGIVCKSLWGMSPVGKARSFEGFEPHPSVQTLGGIMDQSGQLVDLASLPKLDSTARLMALQPLVTQAAEADPAFEAALLANPIKAVTERFGAAAMPNEGEFVRASPDGGFELVFPVTKVQWTFQPTGELPDELLEMVAGGAACLTGPATSTSGMGGK
jgi:hypothetical protein